MHVCQICGLPITTRGAKKFCSSLCYGVYRSTAFRGANHPTYKGRVSMSTGYVRVYVPGHPLAMNDGYVLEHRLVVHSAGIEVPAGYHVHHLNHDKTDNRLENLVVVKASDHNREHIERAGYIENQFGAWSLKRNRKS